MGVVENMGKSFPCNSTECTHMQTCKMLCPIRIGSNIMHFMNGIDSIPTSIGEFKKGPNGKSDYIVAGHIMERYQSPCIVLKSAKDIGAMQIGDKFKSFRDFRPTESLAETLKYMNVSQDTADTVIEKFKKFNSHTILPFSVKPGNRIYIFRENTNTTKGATETEVDMVKWGFDDDTGELYGRLIVHNSSGEVQQLKLKDYGVTWSLYNVDNSVAPNEINRDMIKMDAIGFIKPILVTDNQTTLAIDGFYLYKIDGSMVTIVGAWTNKNLRLLTSDSKITKSASLDYISKSLPYIERHKRFIIPYGMCAANNITIKPNKNNME